MFLTAEVRGNGQTHSDGAGPHLGFIHVTATAYVKAMDLVPAPAQYCLHCHPRVLFTGWWEWLLLAHVHPWMLPNII